MRANRAKTCIDRVCNEWSTITPVARDDIAPFVVAAFDIEFKSSTGKVPDADVPKDACFQMAIALCTFGSEEPYDKTCFCYKKTDPNLEGSNIISFDTEKEMLLAFKEYVNKQEIDIMTGWKIFGLDLEYIYKRADMVGCGREFYEWGELEDGEGSDGW